MIIKLLEIIDVLKFKINYNTYFERKTALKIYNAVFENKHDKFAEYRDIIKYLKQYKKVKNQKPLNFHVSSKLFKQNKYTK